MSSKLSQAEIDKLKAENTSGVFRVKLDNGSEYYFRRLNMRESDAAMEVVRESLSKSIKIQITNTLLFATPDDRALLESDVRVFLAVAKKVNEINKECNGEVSEL
jgi:hypothetical protein